MAETYPECDIEPTPECECDCYYPSDFCPEYFKCKIFVFSVRFCILLLYCINLRDYNLHARLCPIKHVFFSILNYEILNSLLCK